MDSTDPHLDRSTRVFGLGFVLNFEQRVRSDPVETAVGEEDLCGAVAPASDEVAVENGHALLCIVPIGLTSPLELDTPIEATTLADTGKLVCIRSRQREEP